VNRTIARRHRDWRRIGKRSVVLTLVVLAVAVLGVLWCAFVVGVDVPFVLKRGAEIALVSAIIVAGSIAMYYGELG
jgi:hypothetical protein